MFLPLHVGSSPKLSDSFFSKIVTTYPPQEEWMKPELEKDGGSTPDQKITLKQ